jgi:hypothetical protein
LSGNINWLKTQKAINFLELSKLQFLFDMEGQRKAYHIDKKSVSGRNINK